MSTADITRFIAIDTEYHTTNERIDRVYCISACHEGAYHSIWIDGGKNPNILDELASHFSVENPIFVCHAYDKAERQALTFLGVNCLQYKFLDTLTLAYVLRNSTAVNNTKFKLSYSNLCESLLGIQIDTHEKYVMRLKCCDGTVEGFEKEIMTYCEHDTQHLMPLAKVLLEKYADFLDKTRYVKARPSKTPLELVLDMGDTITRFGIIADRGIPLNKRRVSHIKKAAVQILDDLKRDFAEKYAGTYKRRAKVKKQKVSKADEEMKQLADSIVRDVIAMFGDTHVIKDVLSGNLVYVDDDGAMTIIARERGVWTQKQDAIQKHLSKFLAERGMLEGWARTQTGKLKTDKESLKAFKNDGSGFGYDLYTITKQTSAFKGIAQTDGKSWLRNYNETTGRLMYGSMRPYASQTGRCQPKPADGFIFGWYKALYSLMEPDEGKWLVELDFGSEETFIQAAIYHDEAYLEAYRAKDFYLWLCWRMGYIPSDDWRDMSKDELKAKYGTLRSKVKVMALGWSYGMGAKAMGAAIGRDEALGKKVKESLEKKIFHKSTDFKALIQKQLKSYGVRGLGLPDGWIIRSKAHSSLEKMKPLTSIGNFPIQAFGAYILREVVKNVMEQVPKARLLATIHDAIFFEVDEGDYDTIQQVSKIMAKTADSLLGCEGMKVGSPEIVKHGEIWTPEHEYDGQAKTFLGAVVDDEHEELDEYWWMDEEQASNDEHEEPDDDTPF